jgi:hypothetical protein
MNTKKFILILFVFLLVGLWWYFTQSRDYESWSDNVYLNKDSVCVVKYSYSDRKFFGLRHVFTWGGGDPRLKFKVNIDGEDISWNGIYIPILINKYSNIIYMIAYDRKTEFNHPMFRLYKLSESTWVDIDRSVFPKEIALQNMWLFLVSGTHKYNRVNLINDYSPFAVTLDSNEFKRSLNSKLWYFLETGKYTNKDPNLDFLIEFNNRYNAIKHND